MFRFITQEPSGEDPNTQIPSIKSLENDYKVDLIESLTEEVQGIFGEKERKLEDLVTIYLGNTSNRVDICIHT